VVLEDSELAFRSRDDDSFDLSREDEFFRRNDFKVKCRIDCPE